MIKHKFKLPNSPTLPTLRWLQLSAIHMLSLTDRLEGKTQPLGACLFPCSCPQLLFFLVILRIFYFKKRNCTRSHRVQRIKLEPFSSCTFHYTQPDHGGGGVRKKQGTKVGGHVFERWCQSLCSGMSFVASYNPPGSVSRSTVFPSLHRQHHLALLEVCRILATHPGPL